MLTIKNYHIKISSKWFVTSLLLLVNLLQTNASCQSNRKNETYFIQQLEQGEMVKIAALGTSLTGGKWRWFDVMEEWLDEAYPGQITYYNEGVGASATSYPPGNSGLDKVKIVAAYKPDVVFIEFAVNDSYKPYNISIEQSRKNLESIIDTLLKSNPEVEIILQTMNVVIDMPELNMLESTKRSDLTKYLKMYREVASKRNLLLIDHYLNWRKFLKTEGRDAYIKVVTDGVHPNLEGYRKILLPELKEVLKGRQIKWLPTEIQSSSISPEIDDFMGALNGQIRLLHCQYDGSKLVTKTTFSEKELNLNGNTWSCNMNINSVTGDKQAMDLNASFRMGKGTGKSVGVAVAFDFADWSAENYVLLPASVYNGNRCKLVDRGYNAGLDRKYLYQKDIPLMSVPIPQLSSGPDAVSRLEVNAGNMATPAMCFFSKKKKRGFIVLTEQKTQFANNGFIVEESKDRTNASFVISAPGVRERKPEFVGFSESPDRGVDLKAGDQINLKLRIYSFEATNIPALLDKFMQVRKSITGSNNPRNLIPFSQTALWMTERIDSRWAEGHDFQFYCPENANWISFGWIGGLMNTFPMLALGDELHQKRVVKTFDFAIPRGQGASGYFSGALNQKGKCFSREGYPDFPEIVLTRKNADVLFWMIKQFMLLKAQGNASSINPDWEKNIQRLADAFVKTWNENGQWGRMLNNRTGEVAEYNTSGGVMAIGGLALAADYYANPEYLKIAKEAADFYYKRDFVGQGQTTGGCADILQNADSETAAGFMTALMALYETTGEKEWLEKSRHLANLCATWTTSYDYELPPESELGRLGAKLAGIYWASTQNKHGAPGICTSSGDPLFKIYRATGNELYADLMNDIIHAHGESIRPGGYTNERLTYCDAEPHSVGNRGKHVTGWNELNGFLMALELPGIYLQTDGDYFYVFDHVEAKIVQRDEKGITLKLFNPTKYDAEITILAESSKQSQSPLAYTSFIDWPKVEIGAGVNIQIYIDSKGVIKKL
jgi:lysophospholipase L1-like esterase